MHERQVLPDGDDDDDDDDDDEEVFVCSLVQLMTRGKSQLSLAVSLYVAVLCIMSV